MNVDTGLLLWLLIIFEVKHFLGDFPLQTAWMLRKTRAGWDFFWPLAAHAGVHAGFTLAVALYVKPSMWWLSILDFVLHFAMDRIKAGPRYLGRYTNHELKIYWVVLGFDQMVHHLVHLYICWMLALTA